MDHAFGRVGAYSSNGSGDYAIIFSTHKANSSDGLTITREEIKNRHMNGLFMATVEATEEAIINSLYSWRKRSPANMEPWKRFLLKGNHENFEKIQGAKLE